MLGVKSFYIYLSTRKRQKLNFNKLLNFPKKMLYLIGLGLDKKGISEEGFKILKKCDKIYLESYTVDFPYDLKDLEKVIGKNIEKANRGDVEDFKIIENGKDRQIALLVYGAPLTATTHVSLIQEAKKRNIKTKIIQNASIFDAIAETGLQLYKFGKIASMPKWDNKKNFNPSSFIEIIKQNFSIKAHTLLLIDIGLEISDSLKQFEQALKNHKIRIEKIIICSCLGTEHSKILYDNLNSLKKIDKLKKPYCIIIPGELHFSEKEFLEDIT